ncbi:MAG: MiaB/RimO family radical SAM methylthiotransferase [Elusimicrobia bacterium]|nr:MiaB/RimO family radical SAM methylthiotransferase [Elusimicrobiota bacterium]
MKVFITSFGCRVNQYEGEQIREGFVRRGYNFIEDHREADICVVNTCTVTENADKDARRILRKIGRDNPGAKLIITGCYASRAPGELEELFPGALIVSNLDKENIPTLSGCSMGLGAGATAISSFYGHTRAYIKVQDGCNMKCTYCIIPSTRPVMSSRPVEEILAEIRGLFDAGYREFVLCGIRLGRYWAQESEERGVRSEEGKAFLNLDASRLTPHASRDKWVDLIGLIRRIAQLPGDFRIRLSSIEVTDLTDRFLDEYAQIPKAVPYFHVPIQSGSDEVLSAMKRWYNTDFYRRRIAAIHKVLGEEVGLFTDFMVGFPTETGSEFDRSLKFVLEIGFAGLHIFRYSARKTTPAADVTPVYAGDEMENRIQKARVADRGLRENYARRFVGRTMPILWEEHSGGRLKGRAENFLEVFSREQGTGSREKKERENVDLHDSPFPIPYSREWQTVKITDVEGEKLVTHA